LFNSEQIRTDLDTVFVLIAFPSLIVVWLERRKQSIDRANIRVLSKQGLDLLFHNVWKEARVMDDDLIELVQELDSSC
jgi:hypothetical protein